MTTSLKIQYADEIAEALDKALKDEEFTSMFKKEAEDVLAPYRSDLATVTDEEGLKRAWNKHHDAVAKATQNDEKVLGEMLCLQAKKAKELQLPGYASPGCDSDDAQMAEDEGKDECEKCHKCPCVCESAAADPFFAVAEFTVKYLVKMADVLDQKGFKSLADELDETVTKIQKKKSSV